MPKTEFGGTAIAGAARSVGTRRRAGATTGHARSALNTAGKSSDVLLCQHPPHEPTQPHPGRRHSTGRFPQMVRARTAHQSRPHVAGFPVRDCAHGQHGGLPGREQRAKAGQCRVRHHQRRHRPVGVAPLSVPADARRRGGQPGQLPVLGHLRQWGLGPGFRPR
jgi:hypothetical protein